MSAEILPPSNILQRKLAGASLRSLLTPAAERKSAAALESIRGEIEATLLARLAEIESAARERLPGASAQIFAAAHEIRAIAGTFGYEELGVAAEILCVYLEGASPAHAPDPNLTTSIVVTARHCMTQGDAARIGAKVDRDLMRELLAECRQAAKVTRQREGRAE